MRTYCYHIVLISLLTLACKDVSARYSNNLDSLNHLLETAAEDTQKVRILHAIVRFHDERGNLEQVKHYAQAALVLSKKLNDTRGLLTGMNILGILHIKKGEYETARDLMNEALEISKRNKLLKRIANISSNIAISYNMQGQNDKAIPLFMESLKINRQLGIKIDVASDLNGIGILHRAQGRNDTALKYFLEAAVIQKELNDQRGLAYSFQNISQVLLNIGNYDEALTYSERALSIFRERGDRRNQSGALNNMGAIYKAREAYDKAKDCYLQSQELQEQLDDKAGIAASSGNIASLYMEKQHYEQALEFYMKALSVQEQIADQNGMAASYHNIGNLYLIRENYEQATVYVHKSLKIAKMIHDRNVAQASSGVLSKCYEKLGNYPKALNYQKLRAAIKDSILNEASNRQIAEMRIRFETTEKEQENELLKKEQEKQMAELKQKRVQRNVSIAGGFLLLLVAFIWIRSYRQRIKAREQLMAKNEELNREKHLQLQKEQELESVRSYIKGQEAERGRIAGELHDGIVGSLMAVQLRLSHEAPEGDSTHTQAVEALQKIGEETRVLSHLLSPLTLYSGTFTETLQHFIHNLEKAGELKIHFEVFPEDELNQLDTFIQSNLYRISQELLKNTVKHARASELSVQLIQHEEEVNLIVADDGIGFDPDKKGKGIGMGTIRSRLDLVRGDMHIDSHPGKGSSITIRIPVGRESEKKSLP